MKMLLLPLFIVLSFVLVNSNLLASDELWKDKMTCKPSVDDWGIFDSVKVEKAQDKNGVVREIVFYDEAESAYKGSKCSIRIDQVRGKPIQILNCIANDRSREIDIEIEKPSTSFFGNVKYFATQYVNVRARHYANQLFMNCKVEK
jgi:hypothetical protein